MTASASVVRSGFQHRGRTAPAACSCPIHAGRDRDPFTAPLGLPFSDHVTVTRIDRSTAAQVYAAHHGYMPDVPDVNLAHHGLHYQDALVGAITYRYPLLSRKRLRFDESGRLVPASIEDDRLVPGGTALDDLPDPVTRTAGRVAASSPRAVARSEVVPGDAIVEAARVCLGVRMPNLASATLARSQEVFARRHAPDGVRFLLSFVRADYTGAMIRALQDKGWTPTNLTRPRPAGNREHTPIRDRHKWCFVCPTSIARNGTETRGGQAELGRWSS